MSSYKCPIKHKCRAINVKLNANGEQEMSNETRELEKPGAINVKLNTNVELSMSN